MVSRRYGGRISLIIADDHAIVREGLISIFETEDDIEIIGEAGGGREAVEMVRNYDPDVILLDITMPDMGGVEATRQIVAEFPRVKVLILTMHEEEAFFFEALNAGAFGYVLKGGHSDELLDAIRSVHDGQIYVQPSLAGRLAQYQMNRHSQLELDETLTAREREILEFIARGMNNRDIANHLTLSVNTIKSHRLHVYQKLNLHERVELVSYARQNGLLFGD